MLHLVNPRRGAGFGHPSLAGVPWPVADASPARAMLARCPRHARMPLHDATALAAAAAIASMRIKGARRRMGLGGFKALGAAGVIARDVAAGRARGRTYVTASAGNHGPPVAAGAAGFASTPSGAAGPHRDALGLGPGAQPLAILSEAA